jgi:hypothetical protein
MIEAENQCSGLYRTLRPAQKNQLEEFAYIGSLGELTLKLTKVKFFWDSDAMPVTIIYL